ncbi:MAG: RNA 3'-terminal phosphate cyclase [Candidatus Micrarchaeia archaeon]
MIEIDGLVGGGQILRTALSLSAVFQKPFTIKNIRKNRPKTGLAMQHLTCAKAVRSICRGELIGAELGSAQLTFIPGKIVGGRYNFDIGTAGSSILVAQTILPILFNSDKKSTVRIKGGTHVPFSPSYDYFENVFLKAINLMGGEATSKLISTGYYPKGGGEIEINVKPSVFEPILDFPQKTEPKIVIRLGNLPLHIGVREKKIFVHNGLEKVKIIEEKTQSPGNSILIFSGLCGIDTLGEIGKRAEDVAAQALKIFKEQQNYDVDNFLSDQILQYYCFCKKGKYTSSSFTDHLKSNVDVISKFIDCKISLNEHVISIQ